MKSPTFPPQANAALLASATQLASAITFPGQWQVRNNPGANAQATISKAAGSTGVRHVLNTFGYGWYSATSATYTANLRIRDGVAGGGTIIWEEALQLVVTALVGGGEGYINQFRSGLYLIGSPATAMTIEFDAAVNNTTQFVNMSGFSVT